MRSEKLYLTDIIEATDAISRFIAEVDRDEFANDEMRQSAVVQKILVIGEAASHISETLRDKYPEIEWPKIVGMRHILVHGYFGIDLDIVWQVATRRVPELRNQIARILAKEFGAG
jgi:uncharacterized protein with HEPN domain